MGIETTRERYQRHSAYGDNCWKLRDIKTLLNENEQIRSRNASLVRTVENLERRNLKLKAEIAPVLEAGRGLEQANDILQRRCLQLEAELAQRDELFKSAPHEEYCNSRVRATSGKYVDDKWVDDAMPCDCWIKEMKELLGE